jgi:hypothetical protein
MPKLGIERAKRLGIRFLCPPITQQRARVQKQAHASGAQESRRMIGRLASRQGPVNAFRDAEFGGHLIAPVHVGNILKCKIAPPMPVRATPLSFTNMDSAVTEL